MNKEKLLKKYKTKFILGHMVGCCAIFLWMYALTSNLITEKQWYASGLAVAGVCLIVGCIDAKINGTKRKRETLAVMPQIISIHDTVESLKKQRTTYLILDGLFFVVGFSFRETSVVFDIMFSLSLLFRGFLSLTNEKIKYIENKPDGLNF